MQRPVMQTNGDGRRAALAEPTCPAIGIDDSQLPQLNNSIQEFPKQHGSAPLLRMARRLPASDYIRSRTLPQKYISRVNETTFAV
jgi:hypothetical protein